MGNEEKKKGLGNKGFSLVELIIVIAIMAILIGIIGSQAIPYMDKARRGKDTQMLDTVFNAFQAGITDAIAQNGSVGDFDDETLDTIPDATAKQATKDLLGTGLDNNDKLKAKFKSKHLKGHDVKFEYKHATSGGLIGVSIEGTSGKPETNIRITNQD